MRITVARLIVTIVMYLAFIAISVALMHQFGIFNTVLIMSLVVVAIQLDNIADYWLGR